MRIEIIRPLRLLDVGALHAIEVKGSVFESSLVRELEKVAFLDTLSGLMTQPVMPDGEPFEYLVTQAIADYLATRTEPVIDGIIYPSVEQKGRLKRNVVLFHKSSRVEELGLPRGTRVDAHLYDSDDEFRYTHYAVLVWKPKLMNEPRGDDLGFGVMFSGGDSIPPAWHGDVREPSLRIDLPSIKVHHITGVRFSEDEHSVRRQEVEMSERQTAKALKTEEIDF